MQFGRISTNDLRILLSLLPIFEREAAEAKNVIKEKSDRIFGGRFAKVYWCNFYELPFLDHLGQCIAGLGLTDEVMTIASTSNHVEAVVSMINAADAEIDAFLNSASQDALDQFAEGVPMMLALITSVHNSFRCLLAFGLYLNELVARARSGDENALLNAIRIDPTVVGCPTALAYISRAVLVDDKPFMARLKAALSGKLRKREQENFRKMRFVLQVLVETGAEHLTDKHLHELFVRELGLYSRDKEAGDVTKNLRKFANQYMKGSTTT